ncbi:hypothetical protein D3C77_487450 [compost metagenome]
MRPDYCEVEEIESKCLSKHRRVTLQNGDGGTVFLWSCYGSENQTEVPSLVVLSKDVLPKDEILKIQKRLIPLVMKGGVYHDIDS